MTAFKRCLLLGISAAVIFALVSTLSVLAHEKSGPHKSLFGQRWHYTPVGGDYDSWMALTMSPTWLGCAGAELACAKRWEPAVDAAVAEWNGLPITVDLVVQPIQDDAHDVQIIVPDFVLDDPGILGLMVSWDVNGDLCPVDACSVWSQWVLLGDEAHVGPYGTTDSRKATVSHELGHGLALAHESVNANESVLYPCGQDNTGPIPHSVMAYDCIDPMGVGGQGESFVQKWDVCGVNHAYFDPTIGYAYCDLASAVVTDGTLPGDADCNGTVTALDAAVILQLDVDLLEALPCPINADANDSGSVSIIDATVILQFVGGLIVSLPP